MVENKYNCDTVVTTGLSRRTVKFCDFLSNFRKNTAKNTRKFSRLLHFFDIFVTAKFGGRTIGWSLQCVISAYP